MSLSEIERFANDLKVREPLRTRALRAGSVVEGTTARRRPETLLERAIAFAASEGFDFNARELRTYLKAKASAQGEAITYDYIDNLPAAGFFPFAFFREIYLLRRDLKRVPKPDAARTERRR